MTERSINFIHKLTDINQIPHRSLRSYQDDSFVSIVCQRSCHALYTCINTRFLDFLFFPFIHSFVRSFTECGSLFSLFANTTPYTRFKNNFKINGVSMKSCTSLYFFMRSLSGTLRKKQCIYINLVGMNTILLVIQGFGELP